MCGRYAASRKPEDLALEFEAVPAGGQPPLAADYNVAPTKDVYVVRHARERDAEGVPTGGAHRELRSVRWGLVPSWAKDASVGNRMLNARAESLTQKPAFRSAARSRRCLVPADGWFEWVRDGKRKQAYYMTPRDSSVLAFAGIWTMWREQTLTCSVLTTAALGGLAEVHDRMPLILPRERWSQWLAGGGDGPALLAPPTPAELEAIEVRPVRPEVGNVRNNGPELLAAAEPMIKAEVTLF
jgi:putative SOS response-associated peptidase YedK